MGLGPYPTEVGGIADELAELLSSSLRDAAFGILEREGWARIAVMDDGEVDTALKLLSQTPSQRDKTLSRLDDETAARHVLRARYLGLCSRRALQMADDLAFIPGSSYREAAKRGAKAALSFLAAPRVSDIMPGWREPGDDNGYGRDWRSRQFL